MLLVHFSCLFFQSLGIFRRADFRAVSVGQSETQKYFAHHQKDRIYDLHVDVEFWGWYLCYVTMLLPVFSSVDCFLLYILPETISFHLQINRFFS